MRWVHHLRYFASDAWDEFRFSPGVNLLAMTTLTVVLFLAGLAMLLLHNVSQSVQTRLQDIRVEVYLEDGLEESRKGELEQQLTGLEGVDRVEFVSKEEALRRFAQWDQQSARGAEELELNPLPASFELWLLPGPEAESRAGQIAVSLKDEPDIESVRFNREWLRSLEGFVDLARIIGGAFGLVVFSAAVFVMASVLRLAVYARKREIDIMLLIGATPGFVRGPFLVAGLAQGFLSALGALALVEGVRRGARAYLADQSQVIIDWLTGYPLSLTLSIAILAVGLAVSFLGAYFAVRRSV